MKGSHKLARGAAMLALGAAHAAAAQEAPAPAEALEVVLVTAQKKEERLQDVPLAVSALSGDALTQRNASNLLDIQTLIPSVNIQQRQSSGVVTIRGVGFDIITAGAESSVAVHTDGVYSSRPAASLAGLYDIERIEIARGPQGTLYGRNSTGGAVNIITRKPTARLEGYADLTIGNYEAVSAEAAVGGPLIADRLLARVALKTEDRDGFGTNHFDGSQIEDLKTRAARAQLRWLAGDDLSFTLGFDYFKEEDNAFVEHYGGPVAGVCSPACGVSKGGLVAADIRDVNQNVASGNDRVFKTTTLTGVWDISNALTLTSITGYREGRNFFNGDLDATSADLANFTREEDQTQFSEELQFAAVFDRFDLLLGVYYFTEDNFARGQAQFNPATTGRGRFFQGGDLKTEAYAVFAQGTYKITDQLTATLGARYSDERKKIDNELTFLEPAPAVTRASLGLPSSIRFDAFTPKIGLDYHFDDDRMVYVSFQQGFKSGSFAVGSVAPAFDPEEVRSYEAGLRASWLGQALLTNLTAFHYDYSDLQVGFVNTTVVVVGNAAKATVDGVELELRAALTDRLSVDATGSWLDARFDEYRTRDPARLALGTLDLAGNHLSQAPEWSGNLGLEYRFDAFGGDLILRGDFFASSRVFFSPFNLATNSQESYTLANAFVTWRNAAEIWLVSAFVRNLTDETVLTGSFVSTGLVGSIVDASLSPPRTYGVKISRRF